MKVGEVVAAHVYRVSDDRGVPVSFRFPLDTSNVTLLRQRFKRNSVIQTALDAITGNQLEPKQQKLLEKAVLRAMLIEQKHFDLDKVQALLDPDSPLTVYRIAQETGLNKQTLYTYQRDPVKLLLMPVERAYLLTWYYEENVEDSTSEVEQKGTVD